MLSIPRNEIKNIVLKRGVASERPIIDTSLGALFLAAGLYISIPLLANFVSPVILISNSGFFSTSLKPFAFSLLFFPLSGVFFYQVIKKRYYLLVTTRNNMRKIVFEKEVTIMKIIKFIDKVEKNLGWVIEKDSSML